MHENIVPRREFVKGRNVHTKTDWVPLANCEVVKKSLDPGIVVRPDFP